MRHCIINKEMLSVFQKYGGLIDGLLLRKSKDELDIFGADLSNIWSAIGDKIQDLELIKKDLVSQEYAIRVLTELKVLCDIESFIELTKGIPPP